MEVEVGRREKEAAVPVVQIRKREERVGDANLILDWLILFNAVLF